MHTLTREQFESLRRNDDSALIINVLDEDHFQEEHIPGSINIPLSSDEFVQRVEQEAGTKDRKIVVYCASFECDASPKAARKLDEAGFSNVLDYEGGTKDWKEAGHDIETNAT